MPGQGIEVLQQILQGVQGTEEKCFPFDNTLRQAGGLLLEFVEKHLPPRPVVVHFPDPAGQGSVFLIKQSPGLPEGLQLRLQPGSPVPHLVQQLCLGRYNRNNQSGAFYKFTKAFCFENYLQIGYLTITV